MTRTALKMSREEWQAYQPRSRRVPAASRRERAIRLARRAAELLRREYGATRVVLFGSGVQPQRFTRWSDVDLAVTGVPPEKFYAAAAAVTRLSDEFEFDLVDASMCRAAIAVEIAKGMEL